MAFHGAVLCSLLVTTFCAHVAASSSIFPGNNVTLNSSAVSPPDVLSVTTRQPFIMFMDYSETFQLQYTVLCKNVHQQFSIIVKSFDEKVMSVREQSILSASCQNSTEVSNQTTNFLKFGANGKESVSYQMVTPGSNVSLTRKVVTGNLTVILYGELLGRTFIEIGVVENISKPDMINDTVVARTIFPVTIFRKHRPLDTAFRIIIYFFLIYSTLGFGCKLELKTVKENLKKPIAPAIGFGCQYILMPLIAFGIANAVTHESEAVSLGIFVAGCCPGGGVSNIYAYLLGGDLSLSITMTAISSIGALVMLPLWVYTLGSVFVADDTDIKIPFLNIFTTLLLLIIPLIVGVFIKFKIPKVAKGLVKSMTPVTVIAITILLSVGIYSNLYIFKLFNPRIILAGCLLPYCGYILSMIISTILRQPWTIIKTIAIETGIQNTGIAMILMLFAFAPPDGEIAAVGPIASAIMTPLPLFFLTIGYLIYKRCNKKKYESVKTDKKDAEKNGDFHLTKEEKEKIQNGRSDEVQETLINE